MREITAICRAKVNLTLEVLGRRADGYHNLRSVMQSVSLADVVRVREVSGGGIEVAADSPEVPAGAGNTVYAACALFKEAAGSGSGIAVVVEKHIPARSGLGGGSSDAAGALAALNELFGSPLSAGQLAAIAGRVGSDVPYFLAGGTALASGRGDVVEKLPDAPRMDLVIVKPDFGISTAWAYSRLDEVGCRRSRHSAAVVSAVTRGDRTGIIRNLSNDFEDVVIEAFPQIAEIRRRMLELGAEGALLCGSGAAVFGVFPGREEAGRASEALAVDYPFAAVVSTTPVAITLS